MMLFESVDDLLKFFNNIDLDRSTLVLKEAKENDTKDDSGHACACQHDKKDDSDIKENARIELPSKALVESFSVPVELPVTVHEGEDTINVTDYEFLHENFCSSGKLIIENRTVLMQMCDIDGIKKVNLSISLGESKISDNEFIVLKSDTPSILLNKKHIK